jgi:hypothetical protein
MKRTAFLTLATALYAGALLGLAAPPARAAEMQYRGKNLNLEEARSLVGKARYEEALPELATAEELPGNTMRHLADIYALRASALLGLGQTPEHKQQAAATLYQLWHVDPTGTALASATQAARDLAEQVRVSRPIVLHDRIVTARTGRPIRIRARLSTPVPGAHLFVRYRLEPELDVHDVQQTVSLVDADEFAKVELEPQGDQVEAYLRPGVGGVPGDGDHVLRYYVESYGPDGRLLDLNGTPHQPIRMQLSETRTEGAGVGGADAIIATLDEGGRAAHPPPPPPLGPPWYKRWEIIGPVGGVIVAGVVVGLIVAQPKPLPPNGSLGRVDIP